MSDYVKLLIETTQTVVDIIALVAVASSPIDSTIPLVHCAVLVVSGIVRLVQRKFALLSTSEVKSGVTQIQNELDRVDVQSASDASEVTKEE
jgi:hypothetical protein